MAINKIFSKESDVYSFAIVIYELLAGDFAFKNLNSRQIFDEVVVKCNRPSR